MDTPTRTGGWFFDDDQRHHMRTRLRAPALIDSRSAYQAARCRDVSVAGVSVVLREPLATGTVVEVYFELPTGVAIETVAEVARSVGRLAALRFLALDTAAIRALVAFCEMSGVRRVRLDPAHAQ